MAEFVTKAEARAQLRLDPVESEGGPDDLWLEIWIPAVSDAVAAWLKDEWRPYVPEVDSSGEVVTDSSADPIPTGIVRSQVKAAVLLELASQFRFREGEGDNAVPSHEGHGYSLTKAATAILSPLRKSTVA